MEVILTRLQPAAKRPARLQAELADHGIHAGVDRIKRIRRELGLRCRQKRKFRVTTDSRHNLPLASNLLDRQFAVGERT
jgi:putative transposase